MQEGGSVSFDHVTDATESFGVELVSAFGVALSGYGVFRGCSWLLERYRDRIPWRRLRIWWPVFTVGWMTATWFVLWLHPSEDGWFLLVSCAAAGVSLLNLPATLIAVLVMHMLDGLAAVWLCVACSIGAYCAAGYGWVWLLEGYAWRNEEVSLDLRGPERSD